MKKIKTSYMVFVFIAIVVIFKISIKFIISVEPIEKEEDVIKALYNNYGFFDGQSKKTIKIIF